MKVCKFYSESKRRFIRECPNTIVEANYEFVMVVHLLWKLTRKALKAAIKVTKCYVRKAKVKQS